MVEDIELWVDSNDISCILNTYDIREHKDTIKNLLQDISTLKSEVAILIQSIEDTKRNTNEHIYINLLYNNKVQ